MLGTATQQPAEPQTASAQSDRVPDKSDIAPFVITRDQLQALDEETFRECYNAVMAEKMRRFRAHERDLKRS